jgi:formylglycine-generating enzyme required for sulfatase activity
MVGNVKEWVAEWLPRSTACPGWGGHTTDVMCLSGAYTGPGGPGVILRGGSYEDSFLAGPFAIDGTQTTYYGDQHYGFRCAR